MKEKDKNICVKERSVTETYGKIPNYLGVALLGCEFFIFLLYVNFNESIYLGSMLVLAIILIPLMIIFKLAYIFMRKLDLITYTNYKIKNLLEDEE